MGVHLKLLSVQVVGMFAVFALVLFGAAGTLAWTAGWVFLILFFGFVIALSAWLARFNPGLLEERMTGIGKADQKTWDKVFFACANVLFLLWLVSMPLDAVRFRWTHVPALLEIGGAVLMLVSFSLFFATFRANPYLSPAVRIQRERGQEVISAGPYRYVRHPMYAAALVFFSGTALLHGSWLGLLGALPLTLGIAFRAVQEEKTLASELPGYQAYARQVRSRLVPYLW